jgi:hypothetical protein
MTSPAVTVDRIDRAIKTVAKTMVQHDLPQAIVTIRILEAERGRLVQERSHNAAAMDYAKEILRRTGTT